MVDLPRGGRKNQARLGRPNLSSVWIGFLVLWVALLAGCGDDSDDGTKPPVDTTSPAAVIDLTVTAVTDTSATLTWTAPGDDGATGTAQAYEIRRSMTTITEVNWAAATQVPSPPTPKAGGSTETSMVRGLSAGALYFFALKTIDDAGNRSALSNVASDTTAGGEPPEEPLLAVSPAQIDFGADLTAQRLTIRNTGTGTLTWTVSEDGPWLIVRPTTGSTKTESDTVTVTVDRSGLNPGNYSGTVTVTPGTGEPRSVAVTMSVAVPPTLALSVSSLDFGADQTDLSFAITNTGTGTLTWTSAEDQPWLSVSPTNGSTTTESDQVTVTVDRTGLSVGEFAGTVTVTPDTGAAHTVGIQMSIAGGGGFVLLPPGTFTMGSPADEPGRDPDETPHLVTLTKAFYVATHEVTQSEWQSVMGWNESFFPGANRPVEWVTWFDCISYCNQRSTQDGYTGVYQITDPVRAGNHITSATVTWDQAADGYRLLTEAEWEYACRAASETAFCNGAITQLDCSPLDPNLDLVGWYCGNSTNTTQEVGGKAANTWDLQDMHGNVWEWCWDWYASYPGGTETDPIGSVSGSLRVIRGGCWGYPARYGRSAFRSFYYPDFRGNILGLRLARTAP